MLCIPFSATPQFLCHSTSFFFRTFPVPCCMLLISNTSFFMPEWCVWKRVHKFLILHWLFLKGCLYIVIFYTTPFCLMCCKFPVLHCLNLWGMLYVSYFTFTLTLYPMLFILHCTVAYSVSCAVHFISKADLFCMLGWTFYVPHRSNSMHCAVHLVFLSAPFFNLWCTFYILRQFILYTVLYILYSAPLYSKHFAVPS